MFVFVTALKDDFIRIPRSCRSGCEEKNCVCTRPRGVLTGKEYGAFTIADVNITDALYARILQAGETLEGFESHEHDGIKAVAKWHLEAAYAWSGAIQTGKYLSYTVEEGLHQYKS